MALAGALVGATGVMGQPALAQTTALAAQQGWVLDRWTTDEGLPTNLLNGVAVAADGTVWVASFDGLAGLDGASVQVVRRSTHPALSGNRFVALRADRQGRLWALEELGSVVHLPAGAGSRWQRVATPDPAHAIAVVDGLPWLLGRVGISSLAGSVATPWRRDVVAGRVVAVTGARGGGLWVAGADGAVWRVGDDGPALRLERAPGTWSAAASVLHDDGSGGVWVGTDATGLLRSSGGVLHGVVGPDWLHGQRPLRELWTDGDGAVRGRSDDGWWTLRGASWWQVDGGRWEREGALAMSEQIGHVSGHSLRVGAAWWRIGPGGVFRDRELAAAVTGQVVALAADRGDGLWIATDRGGLYHLRRAAVATWRLPAPHDPVVDAVACRQDGTVAAISHDGALLLRTPGGSAWTEGSLSLRSPGDAALGELERSDRWPTWTRHRLIATAALGASDGSLWVGTDAGVGRWSPAGLAPAPTGQPGGPHALVVSLHEDSRGRLWAGSAGGLAVAPLSALHAAAGQPRAGSAWRAVTTAAGATLASPHSFLEQASGDMLVTTAGLGLARVRDGEAEILGAATRLPSLRLRGMLDDGDGFVWIGSQDAGLCRIRLPTTAAPAPAPAAAAPCLDRRHGLQDDTVHGLVRDDRDRLWLSGNRGVSVLRRGDALRALAGQVAAPLVIQLGRAHGMVAVEANGFRGPAIVPAAAGRWVIPTQDGVVVLTPAHWQQPPPPPVLLDASAAAASAATNAGLLTLSPDQPLTLRWSAPEFAHPGDLRFRLRLGPTAPWRDLGSRRQLQLDGLPPGRHQVELQAGLGGVWSAAAPLAVVRTPAFRETWGFAAALVAASLLLAALGAVGWAGRQRRRREALEAIVAARTDDLRASNRQLTDQAALLARQGAEISEQVERMRVLEQRKSTLVANLSHELRTPLMLLSAPVAELAAHDDGRDREALRLIERSAATLQRIIDRLLDTASLDAGVMVLRPLRGDLSARVVTQATTFQPAALAAGVSLLVEPAGVPIWTMFDPDLLDMVIANLLVNALKFTPAGGVVRVRVEAPGADGSARVHVHDTGPGLASEERERVFERFYQVRGGDDRSHPGLGIGLSLAKEIVALHRGQIGVRSALGQGADFWFWLPDAVAGVAAETAAVAEQPAQRRAAAEGEPALSATGDERPQVLLVEDDEELRQYLTRALGEEFAIQAVADGHAALLAMASARPDVVVSDVMMPGMDGLALCRRVRADERLRELPIVLISAKAAAADIAAGRAVAQDYVVKPFPIPALIERLRLLIGASPPSAFAAEPSPELAPSDDPDVQPARPMVMCAADAHFVARVRAVIDARLDDAGLSVADLAKRVALSPRQFQRELVRTTGQSPHALLSQARLAGARSWLETHPRATLAEAAASVGLSPRQLRRLMHPPDAQAPESTDSSEGP